MCSNTGLCRANGHPSAFGFEIADNNINAFLQEINPQLANNNFTQEVIVDVQLNPEDITTEWVDQIKEFDRLTGTNCPPVSVLISVDNYDVGTMSQGKHLVIKPNDKLDIIQWNYTGSIPAMEDNALLGNVVTAVGNLDSGFLGRRFSLKLIANSIEVTS